MNTKFLYKLSALFILPFLFLGCFEEHATQFHLDDVNQVEWAPPDPSSSSLSYTAELDADQTEPVTIELEVQLIGAQTSSERTAGVIVSETDADEGVHFELLSNDVLIPANSNHGIVQVQILSENIANGESYSAILELQESSELGVAVNLKDMDFRIEKDEN
ncbi:hypothetical protein BH23BAC3_BH23BAC3_28740 [soil metagenome]